VVTLVFWARGSYMPVVPTRGRAARGPQMSQGPRRSEARSMPGHSLTGLKVRESTSDGFLFVRGSYATVFLSRSTG
jgi:hypothetical protein